jgi:hypothetical protein
MAGLSLPDAWERWDQRPSDAQRARQLTEAEKAAGELLGISHMAVHEQLVEHKRSGMTYDEAIDALRAEHEPPES